VWLPSEVRNASHHVVLQLPRLLGPPARDAREGREPGTPPVKRTRDTLNGTACAVGRRCCFLFEHYQAGDGGFVVPGVLRPCTGFDRVDPGRVPLNLREWNASVRNRAALERRL